MEFTDSAIYVYENWQHPGHCLLSIMFPPPHTHLKTSSVALQIQWFPQIPEDPLLHPHSSSPAKAQYGLPVLLSWENQEE